MSWPWEALVEPVLRYPFMRDGLIVAVVVGASSAVLSCLLVVRRQALLGDAIAHAVLLGVAVGWLAAGRVGVFAGALAAGVLAGVAIVFIERSSRVKLDAAMGVVFTTAFALGLAIISYARPPGVDLFHVLFGNVVGVSQADVWLTAVSGILVLAVVLVLFRDFQLWSFDPEQARVLGVPVGALQYVFTALLSAAIVASLQAVGIVLVIAMLVIPGATAYLLAERLAAMMRVAAACGIGAAVTGLYSSYYVDVASGPAIVLVAGGLFALALVAAPKRGLVVRAVRSRRLVRRVAREDLLKSLAKRQRLTGRPAVLGDLDATARRAARGLERRGLATLEQGQVRISPDGESEAVRVVRAHRLLEAYLVDAEGFELDQVHAEADRREHVMADEEIDDLAFTLGRPAVDPHGHRIPAEPADLGTVSGQPLAGAEPGSTVTVAMVADDRDDLVRAMMRRGLVPGVKVAVVAREPGRLHVRAGGRDLALGDELTSRVFVVDEGAGGEA